MVKSISVRTENREPARRLDVLDETQSYEDFCKQFAPHRLPLGYHMEDMQKVAIPLQQLNSMSLYFGNKQGVAPMMRNLIFAMQREQAELILVKRDKDSLVDTDSAFLMHVNDMLEATVLPCSQDGIDRLYGRMSEAIRERKVHRNTCCQENGIGDWSDAEAVRQWRKYLRAKTKPLFVVFESLLDTVIQIDVSTAAKLESLFRFCQGYNIYFVAGFYADDDDRLQDARYPNGVDNALEDENSQEYIRRRELRIIWEKIQRGYNPDKFALLFGGRLDRQQVVSLPSKWQKVKNPSSLQNIDKCLMHYHGETYSLVMPCEKPDEAIGDIDELEIICDRRGQK
jgi:hypothetical protein